MQIDARCPSMLALAPSDDALADAVTWLTGLCLRDGWPALDSLAATLVLEEALTNILKYGLASSAQDHAALVRLRFTRGCGIAALRIMDNGPPFDPLAAQPRPHAPSLDQARPGGQGLRLMRHYTRAMRYRRRHGQNELTLFFQPGR
ncbi:MAG: ATP-binding protein [Achromobacter sp.]|nr:ATP-binding protein [Achromobacter sp.]